MRHRFVLSLIVMCTILATTAAPAAAQAHAGVRAGISVDPDQFFFGGHIETQPLLERLSFRPNVEIGVGDDVTTIALNLEFVYSIPLENAPWRVYFGGGPAANIYSFEDGRGNNDDDSDVRGGFNILLGAQHSGGLFTELKVGAIDSPNLKFTVGYAFR